MGGTRHGRVREAEGRGQGVRQAGGILAGQGRVRIWPGAGRRGREERGAHELALGGYRRSLNEIDISKIVDK